MHTYASTRQAMDKESDRKEKEAAAFLRRMASGHRRANPAAERKRSEGRPI